MRAAGLFAGIGGLELGMQRAQITTEFLCEWWEPAASTLRRRFHVPVVGDVREVSALPSVEVVTAGFPCTDLSQAGRTAGLSGVASGLVREAFRLVDQARPTWVVLENVPNMLTLSNGAAIREITRWFDDAGWNWAYRTVDSQHFGVRQRRRRVFLVASQTEDPRGVLFADDAPIETDSRRHAAYGFSWTEGNRGLGWGPGVTPTLKGGSTLGIASPPGIWLPGAEPGAAILKPAVETGERLQGFRAGWTSAVASEGVRWKLIGNAVTVPVAEWLGRRLTEPGDVFGDLRAPLDLTRRWPWAASSVSGLREQWRVSERPQRVQPRGSLASLVKARGATPLSAGATAGFTRRLKRSSLRPDPEFLLALEAHVPSAVP